MSFDPSLPLEHTEMDAAQMRAQFLGLKALIDGITALSAAQVDAVNTLPPGSNATVSVSVVGNTLHFTFALPQGNDGGPGPQGIQGPPFAGAIVDSVNTVPAGFPATVDVSFDGTNVHFTFGIPQGAQGTPGEVTNVALASAINGTSSNTNGVNPLGFIMSDPPTQTEVQQVLNKVDELILALRR